MPAVYDQRVGCELFAKVCCHEHYCCHCHCCCHWHGPCHRCTTVDMRCLLPPPWQQLPPPQHTHTHTHIMATHARTHTRTHQTTHTPDHTHCPACLRPASHSLRPYACVVPVVPVMTS